MHLKKWIEHSDADYYTMFINSWIPFNVWYQETYYDEQTCKTDSKHSIASVDISMKSNTFALQNIKQRIWQAVKILKGYWNFTTRSQRQVEYQLFLSVKRMVSFTLSLRGGTRTVIR